MNHLKRCKTSISASFCVRSHFGSSLGSSRLPGGKTGSAKSLRVAGRGVSVATCPSVGRSVVFGRYGLA